MSPIYSIQFCNSNICAYVHVLRQAHAVQTHSTAENDPTQLIDLKLVSHQFLGLGRYPKHRLCSCIGTETFCS